MQDSLATDSLRAVLDAVFAGRDYRWDERPDLLQLLAEAWQRLNEWLAEFFEGNPVAARVALAVLGVAVALALARAAYAFFTTVRGATRRDDERPPEPEPVRDAAWYLRRVDAAAAAGRYTEALRLAFHGVVLRLDELGAIRYTPGKTPAEYAREARLGDAESARLDGLVRTLYQCVYAGAVCGPDDYARWRAIATEWHVPAT